MAEAKIQFTPAQAAAIQARGGSLLVSAAAGFGGTRPPPAKRGCWWNVWRG